MPLYSFIGRTQKNRNTHGHNITSRSNTYEDTGLRGEELAEHYMSIKNDTDEQANDICDNIDDRIDNALSNFLDAQEKIYQLKKIISSRIHYKIYLMKHIITYMNLKQI